MIGDATAQALTHNLKLFHYTSRQQTEWSAYVLQVYLQAAEAGQQPCGHGGPRHRPGTLPRLSAAPVRPAQARYLIFGQYWDKVIQ